MKRTCLATSLPLLAATLLALSASRLSAADASAFPAVKDLPVRAAMPDPLAGDDGKRITTPEQWKERREKIKQILEYYALGHRPPPPEKVVGRELQSKQLMDGKVTFRLVHLAFGPDEKLGFDMAIFVPADTAAFKAPFPTIVQPSFFPTPGTTPARPQGGAAPRAGGRAPFSFTLEDVAKQYAEPLRRGYAIATFYYQQAGADKPDFRKSGFFPAYPDYDWGDLAAWSWAMSRCVDYLETQPFADKTKFIALGHSRLGKTTLVAGAFDDRFALTAPAGSGCGGTGAYRFNGKGRGGKEGLEDATKNFPQWFGPHLRDFAGHVDKLPFDQHWLIDLIAPRLFIAADGAGRPGGKWQGAGPVLSSRPAGLRVPWRAGSHRHQLSSRQAHALAGRLDGSAGLLRQIPAEDGRQAEV